MAIKIDFFSSANPRSKVSTESDSIYFQELRVLKNFSSLKAIISGLQSNPVYRLKKAWGHLPRDKMETFQVCL